MKRGTADVSVLLPSFRCWAVDYHTLLRSGGLRYFSALLASSSYSRSVFRFPSQVVAFENPLLVSIYILDSEPPVCLPVAGFGTASRGSFCPLLLLGCCYCFSFCSSASASPSQADDAFGCWVRLFVLQFVSFDCRGRGLFGLFFSVETPSLVYQELISTSFGHSWLQSEDANCSFILGTTSIAPPQFTSDQTKQHPTHLFTHPPIHPFTQSSAIFLTRRTSLTQVSNASAIEKFITSNFPLTSPSVSLYRCLPSPLCSHDPPTGEVVWEERTAHSPSDVSAEAFTALAFDWRKYYHNVIIRVQA